ncbi:hypothetical protein VTK73DRAFT_482 [Phialemonium thermophilum]|uniref:Integral membrane protein n=1 Tax=Phialemonium thermophilum TaxID=223376 RepID=A0ABR3XFB4_9PEZI
MPEHPTGSQARQVQFLSVADRQPSAIRLRRIRSNVSRPPSILEQPEEEQRGQEQDLQEGIQQHQQQQQQQQQQPPQQQLQQPQASASGSSQPTTEDDRSWQANRRRSSSEPQRPTYAALMNPMSPVPEGREHHGVSNPPGSAPHGSGPTLTVPAEDPTRRRGSWGFSFQGRRRPSLPDEDPLLNNDEYDSRIVDILDVVDPEVSTLSSITNIQNSLFIPSLGRFVNRRPTYDFDWVRGPPADAASAAPQSTQAPQGPEPEARRPSVQQDETSEDEESIRPIPSVRAPSLRSTIVEPNYAVLPHGVSLEGWTDEEIAELNDHVRHMLHSRRSAFKRSMKAFGKYVRRPLGFFVTLYATLITLFGLAWVLFLIGWIYVGAKQLYVINVIDNVLVALFAIVGDGLAPFRAVDTYHMIFIAYYHRLTWKRRKQLALPKLQNKNDLPTQLAAAGDVDVEAGRTEESREVSVLTPKQHARLMHHQAKFAKSHTFYKPHETETHYAFPLNYLIAIVVLLDMHSCLQISLGACTWGIDYHTRPAALTATILSCSITVNITAGILISLGGRRTRKKDVIERMFRQELTTEALREMRARGTLDNSKMKRIDEVLDEGGDSSEEKEKRGKSFDIPRPSLDAWRGRHSESAVKTNRGSRPHSKRKASNEVGKFDTSVSAGRSKSQEGILPEEDEEKQPD